MARTILPLLAVLACTPVLAQEEDPPADLGYELRGVLGDSALFEPAAGGKQILLHAGDALGPYRVVRVEAGRVEVERDGRRHVLAPRTRRAGTAPRNVPPYPHASTAEFETARRALETWRVAIRAAGEPLAEVVGRIGLDLGLAVEWTDRAAELAAAVDEGVVLATPPVPLGAALRLLLAPRGLDASPAARGLTIHAAGEVVGPPDAERIHAGLAQAREILRAAEPARRAPPEALERLESTRIDLDAAGRSLGEVLAFLGGQVDLEFALDPSVRDWLARHPTAVEGTFDQEPLEEVLAEILDPLGLVHEPTATGIVVRLRPGSGSVRVEAAPRGPRGRLAEIAVPETLAGWSLAGLVERLAAEVGLPVRFAVELPRQDPQLVALPPGTSVGANLDAILARAGLTARIVEGVLVVATPGAFDRPQPPPPGTGLAARVDVRLDRASFLEAVNRVGAAAGLEISVDLAALEIAKGRRYDTRLTGTAASALDAIVGPVGLSYTLRGRVVQIHPSRSHPRLGAGRDPVVADPLAGRSIDVEVDRDSLLEVLRDIASAARVDLNVDLPVLDAYKDRRYSRRFRGPADRVLADFLAAEGLAYSIEASGIRVHLHDTGGAALGPLARPAGDVVHDDASFLQVVGDLARGAGLGLVVDEAVLDQLADRGLNRFSPRFRDLTAGEALASFLGPLGLGYELRQGAVHVFAIAPPGADDRAFAALASTPVPPELVGLRLEVVLAAVAAAAGIDVLLTPEASALYEASGAPLVPSGLGSGRLVPALERLLDPLGLELAAEGQRLLVVPQGAGAGAGPDPLEARIDLDASFIPAREALARLIGPLGLLLVVDPALEEALTIELGPGQRYVEVPLAEALGELLEPLGAAFAIRDGRLYVYPVPGGEGEAEARRARTRLGVRVDLTAIDSPLGEVLQALARAAGLEARLDPAALRLAGQRGADRVTARFEGAPFSSALREILDPRGLDWFAGDGFLFVSTPESVQAARVERARREMSAVGRGREAEKVLSARHRFAFDRVPWARFVAELERLAGVRVVSDPVAWAAHPTVALAGEMTLEEALRKIQSDHEIGWVLLDGVLYLVRRP